MKRRLATSVFAMLMLTEAAFCCVYASLPDVHVSRNFKVIVKRYGAPVEGASLAIYQEGKRDKSAEIFSGTTSKRGVAEVRNLPGGRYFMVVTRSGIEAGEDTIVVDAGYGGKTKRTIRYKWAELAPSVRTLTGVVSAYKLKRFGAIFVNVKDSQTPRNGVLLELENARTGQLQKATTDESGRFDFGRHDDGIYVIHLRDNGPPFGDRVNDDLAFELSSTGRLPNLALTLTWSDCGVGYQVQTDTGSDRQ